MKKIIALLISLIMIAGCSTEPVNNENSGKDENIVTTNTPEPQQYDELIKSIEDMGYIITIPDNSKSVGITNGTYHLSISIKEPSEMDLTLDLQYLNATDDKELIVIYYPVNERIFTAFKGDAICLYDLNFKEYLDQSDESLVLCNDDTLEFYANIKEMYDITLGSLVESPQEYILLAYWVYEKNYSTSK